MNQKRRRGDRPDGALSRDLDAMHVFFPFLLPKRTDNEAVMNETVDLSAVNAYIARKNAENPEYKYTLFQVICAAIAKTVYLRPKLNRFIAGHRTYDRHDLSFSFVVKQQFTDDGHEALAILKMDQESDSSPIQQFHDKLQKIVHSVRVEKEQDSSTDVMDVFKKFPRWLSRIAVGALRIMDYYGKLPRSIADADPYRCTVFITNLGSIQMHASYHHLVNWGTNSFFVVVSEKYDRPYFDKDGSYEMREVLDFGITVDERIADGIYFAGCLHILRQLMAEPELLDLPFSTPISLDSGAKRIQQSKVSAK